MIKRKNIIIAAILATFGIGFGATQADSGNNLLQMNVKKSSVADTVDVTFFTTGDNQNSVVTRKSNNKYVVLLPNTSSNSSVAPSIGGIKDLVSNVEVKHVDDGIGGYTKVTFETTKPINIKTFTKKTSPLTQAQKDYKTILAQNNAQKPQAKVEQKTTTTQTKAPAAQTTTEKPKVTASQPKKTVEQTKATQTQAVKEKSKTPVKSVQTTAQTTKASDNTKVQTQVAQEAYVPKMKFDEQGKRKIDLEPRVSHSKEAVDDNSSLKTAQNTSQEAVGSVNEVKNEVKENISNEKNTSKSAIPTWLLLLGGSILTLGVLSLAISLSKKKSINSNKERLASFAKKSSEDIVKRRNSVYSEIANNSDMNWQEKYKTYKAKEDENVPKKNPAEMSYVTDLSGLRKSVISQDDMKKTNIPVKTFDQIRQEKLQEKVSRMEHSLNQVHEYHEVSNDVKSEDTKISERMSEVKLKSFSKMISLKEANRGLLSQEKEASRNKSYKEGRFVKLKNSPLSVTNRNHGVFEASDLINTGNKYLTNNGEMKMTKENENYLLSSLDEYLSILDIEEKDESKASQSIKSATYPVMTRSGVTNPISKANNISNINGMSVKSGYNIDAEKGFYLVNIDGVSALVGKIKDSIFMLKKFDYVVDKPLQVRRDDNNVYIARVGKFKCLVDVSNDKMGTLLEI